MKLFQYFEREMKTVQQKMSLNKNNIDNFQARTLSFSLVNKTEEPFRPTQYILIFDRNRVNDNNRQFSSFFSLFLMKT